MELRYGDSEYKDSWIRYELGPLVCSGKGFLFPSEIEASDFSFKIASSNDPAVTFLEKNKYLEFPEVVHDKSNGLTTNSFTAPVTGKYQFQLNLLVASPSGYRYGIDVELNNIIVHKITKNGGAATNGNLEYSDANYIEFQGLTYSI